jgi:hypothetical protein
VANSHAVSAPAGDYLLTVQVTSTGAPLVSGTILQYEGGSGPWERVDQFHASRNGTTVQAQVRTTGPADKFVVKPSGGARVSALTLTPATWGYLARGTKVTDPSNTNLIWHGVNSNPDLPIPSGIQALAANTRANIVRVPVFEYQWLPFFRAAYVSGYRQHIIDTVKVITAAGMTAIVDLHAAGHDNPASNPGYSDSGQLGPDQQSIAFWQDAAALWGGNLNVVFELFNEPRMTAHEAEPGGRTGAQVWRDGGTLTDGSETWVAPGMQQLTDTIRATGASNLILIDGLNWAGDLLPVEKAPIDGTNLAYAFHAYPSATEDPTVVPPHLATDVGPVIDPGGSYRFASLATEFGTTEQDGQLNGNAGSAYLASTIAWIAKHGIGWLVWGWYPHTWDAYGLLWSFPLTLTSRSETVVRLM